MNAQNRIFDTEPPSEGQKDVKIGNWRATFGQPYGAGQGFDENLCCCKFLYGNDLRKRKFRILRSGRRGRTFKSCRPDFM